MATYAIGDVQGCLDPLVALLEKINFNPSQDRIWFTGDIINRGSQSLETIEFIQSLGDSMTMVLGNHDLHLLAVYYGDAEAKAYDTLDAILKSPECPQICNWLRHQPILHHDPQLNYTLAHAGIFPEWDLEQAQKYAAELESALRGPEHTEFFKNMYGDYPDHWEDGYSGIERLRFITNCFTRMRLCGPGDRLNLKKKGPPKDAPENYVPWFKIADRANKDLNIIFGHWAALECETYAEPGIFPVDSGCVWGRCLTALRLEDRQIFCVDCDSNSS